MHESLALVEHEEVKIKQVSAHPASQRVLARQSGVCRAARTHGPSSAQGRTGQYGAAPLSRPHTYDDAAATMPSVMA